MAITIKDLAQMANTSTATVSRVLSNKPGVAESKRRVIIQLAEKVGYSPNRIAQNLALQKSHVLGFIAADLQNFSYVDFFRHVQHRVEQMGYQVLIADSEQSVEKERHNIEVMRQHRAEGIIVFPVHDWKAQSTIDHFLQLRLQKFPFVLIGKIDDYGFDFVSTEEVEASYRMTKHLIDQGHRRIAFVGCDTTNRCIKERFDGFTRAMKEAHLEIAPSHVIQLKDGWWDEMKALLSKPGRPTALFMINDVLALIAQRPLLELAIRIPEELSVVAFGSGAWMTHLRPALTASVENNAEVSRVALETLLKRIDNPDIPPMQQLIPQDFIVRESTATSH